MSLWRFMGEQEDPEMDVWEGRGLRIYDGMERVVTAPIAPSAGPRGSLRVVRNGKTVRCTCSDDGAWCLLGAPCKAR